MSKPGNKPIGSVSLDLDNLWSYMKTHGDSGWESFPSYLDIVVPRALELLDELGLKITFFIVGQDAALPKNHRALRMIADAGHEIGNHSFHHEPWLHLYSKDQIHEELARAEEAIEQATGQKPVGFRGPGFSHSPTLLRVLMERGYLYDASTFPTFLGPLARAYYFMTTKLPPEEMEKRKQLFGKFSEGFRPLKPYFWVDGERRLLEIPVTTMPVAKIPTHLSYLLYIASFSATASSLYRSLFIKCCQITKVSPSVLLHPLDIMSSQDAAELRFFPAMRLATSKKISIVRETLSFLAHCFDVVTTKAHYRQCAQQIDFTNCIPIGQ